MPKYYDFKIGDYYLYFTSHCTVEAFHVHASDKKLTEAGSAKFFVDSKGNSKVANRGRLKDRDITNIQKFIKNNYIDMYNKWKKYDTNAGGYYNNIK